MSSASEAPIVGTKTLPDAVRRLASLPAVDFADMYTLRTSPDDSSAETWARAILGDVPNLAENLAWHWLLRFPLHHEKSAAHVAGWRIGGKADEWIRIENSSWLMDGNIVVVKKQQEVSLVTMVRYKSRFAPAWWWLLSFLHRRGAPGLLQEGALKMQKSA